MFAVEGVQERLVLVDRGVQLLVVQRRVGRDVVRELHHLDGEAFGLRDLDGLGHDVGVRHRRHAHAEDRGRIRRGRLRLGAAREHHRRDARQGEGAEGEGSYESASFHDAVLQESCVRNGNAGGNRAAGLRVLGGFRRTVRRDGAGRVAERIPVIPFLQSVRQGV